MHVGIRTNFAIIGQMFYPLSHQPHYPNLSLARVNEQIAHCVHKSLVCSCCPVSPLGATLCEFRIQWSIHVQLPIAFKSLCVLSPVGQLKKAAEAAATFIAMEPSDEVMANNIRYYTSTFKVEAEAFVPRQVSICTARAILVHVIMGLYHGIILWVGVFISNSISTGAPILSCFTRRSQIVKKYVKWWEPGARTTMIRCCCDTFGVPVYGSAGLLLHDSSIPHLRCNDCHWGCLVETNYTTTFTSVDVID